MTNNDTDLLLARHATVNLKPPLFNKVTGTFVDGKLEREAQLALWPERRKVGIGVTAAMLPALMAFAIPAFTVERMGVADLVAVAIEGTGIAGMASALTLLIRNRPGIGLDIALFIPSLTLAAFIIDTFFSGILPWGPIISILTGSAFIYGVFLPHRPPFAIATIFLLMATYLCCITFGQTPSDPMGTIMFMLIWTTSVLVVRSSAMAQRRTVYQQSQYERLAEKLDGNLQDLEIENRAVERAAEENAALADELTLARMAAEENAYYLESVLENIAQGVVVTDKDWRITKFNNAYKELAGIPDHLAKPGTNIVDIVRDALQRGLYVDKEGARAVRNALDDPAGPRPITAPVVLERAQGNGRYVEVRRSPLPDGGEVSTYTDITERKLAEQIIRTQAQQDPLTRLANRHRYDEQLVSAIARSKRNGRYVALAYLDLDCFKPVNDTYGHPVGDEVLKVIASTIRAYTREVDTVARLGGDEFAIIFDGIEAVDDVRNPIERIMRAVFKPIHVGDIVVTIGISAGVTFYPLDAETAEKLGEMADRALYEAKQSGRGCCKFARSEYEAGLPKIDGTDQATAG